MLAQGPEGPSRIYLHKIRIQCRGNVNMAFIDSDNNTIRFQSASVGTQYVYLYLFTTSDIEYTTIGDLKNDLEVNQYYYTVMYYSTSGNIAAQGVMTNTYIYAQYATFSDASNGNISINKLTLTPVAVSDYVTEY